MRIHYTMPSYGPTAGLRVAIEQGNALARRGHDVSFSAPVPPDAPVSYPTAGPASKDLSKADWWKLEAVKKFFGPTFRNTEIFTHVEVLSGSAPDCDVNVATAWYTAYSVATSGKGLGVYYLQHDETLFNPGDPFRERLTRLTFDLPLRKYVNSRWLQRRMGDLYRMPDLPLVTPALDHKVFRLGEPAPKGRRPRVVSMAKPYRWKGWPEAVAAMQRVQAKTDVEFVVFGHELPFRPEGLDVTLVRDPSDEELAALYRSANVVLCPSWYESFPLPPLEAMACGSPVVTTLHGTEDYAVDRENCMLVEPKDAEAFAGAILDVLHDADLAARLRAQGLKTAQRYQWDDIGAQAERVLERMLDEAAASS